MPNFVEFDNVSHHYDQAKPTQVATVQNLSFSINKNEFVAVVGPSGCGKSTLSRLLSGLIQPTYGTVKVFNKIVTEPRDDVGIVFQKPTLLPWLNVEQNVLFPLKHKYGRVSSRDKQKASELIAMVGLSKSAKQRPQQLSGGMQQRVSIARSLLFDPDILIMDEPFSALDALTREEMGFELLRIWHEKPKTVLFITHSISEAILLADRVLVLTGRPGSVAEIVNIEIPRPRRVSSLHDERFTEYANRIRSHIYQTSGSSGGSLNSEHLI